MVLLKVLPTPPLHLAVPPCSVNCKTGTARSPYAALMFAWMTQQDRFNSLMPALTKWGGTMVGVTLLLIGALGIYERFFEDGHDDDDGDELETISAAPMAAWLPPLHAMFIHGRTARTVPARVLTRTMALACREKRGGREELCDGDICNWNHLRPAAGRALCCHPCTGPPHKGTAAAGMTVLNAAGLRRASGRPRMAADAHHEMHTDMARSVCCAIRLPLRHTLSCL